MKTLILIRHSKTEQVYNDEKPDFERELVPRGFQDASFIAKKLIERNIVADIIISSTATRAKQTAQLFASELQFPVDNINYQQFLYDGYTTTEFLEFLATFGSEPKTIVIIAHNPEIAIMAMNLGTRDYFQYPTTAVTSISFNVDNWNKIEARQGKTDWFISPKSLKINKKK